MAPRTLARWFAVGHAPLRNCKPGGSILDPFRIHLERRYAQGCHNARLLWCELRALSFEGQPTIVRTWIGRWNKAQPDAALGVAPLGPRWTPPSAHAVTRILVHGGEGVPNGYKRACECLLSQVPELAAAADAAGRLVRLLRRESKEPLADVLNAMRETALARLAASLERDKAAVQATLDAPWTTIPVEGQVNRLKLIKRTMYGRAGFALLRSRVLQAA